jgi:chemotaxis protein methyltransferase CheR
MKTNLSESMLLQLSEFIAARTALHFPRERWSELEQKMISAAREFGFTNDEEFVQWLVSSSLTMDQIEILASHLTIGETYFWREPQVFEALEAKILPELIRSREHNERRIRIWSAGCATGEEPYSIAIALSRLIPSIQDWHITILATDINPRILRRATAGVYGKWSFRNAPRWLKEGYFRRSEDGKYEVLPKIRQMVTFAYLNLAEDVYPSSLKNTSAMDIIFCRNVLMYFAKERAVQVGYGLFQSLIDGGWLIVGACELSHQIFPQFVSVNFPGAVGYRKDQQEFRQPALVQLQEISPQECPIQQPLKFVSDVEQITQPPQSRESAMMQVGDSESAQQRVSEAALNLRMPSRSTDVKKKLENDEAPQALGLSVRELANQGKLAEALALCEKAIAAIKLDPALHYLRAIILQEQTMYSEAITALKRVLYLDPNFVLAHFTLGNLFLRQGNVRTARKCFRNVLALLSTCGQEDILLESEGLTAGRLREIIRATIQIGL